MSVLKSKISWWGAFSFLLLYVAAVVISPLSFAEQTAQAAREAGTSEDVTALAKKTQNPVSDLISLPFQNNLNFGAGPKDDRIQDILNIQPVVPIGITKDWNLIVRTIVPLIWQPEIQKESGHTFGLGDINNTFFLSPKNSGKVIWGAGPAVIFPTATDGKLGSRKWNLGPSLVVLTMPRNWVIGALVSQTWSLGGDDDRRDTAPFLLQYFVNYNFPRGWYFTSAPIITADWKAPDNDAWTVPVGGGFGKIFRIWKLPVNAQVQAFYNITRPELGPDWSLRFQLQFLFPKGK